ncbi:unnamed protein product [Diatraea saccharalis]|uniref:Uncharacterized protein n=1 Tax=Diatraea saccharalis TaxID=40085 RepID=A0A9N9R3Z1_9NEOP|nr:unnamed protein product [Diatraea saccharalis]
MSFKRDMDTHNALKTEIKGLKSGCIDAFNLIENSPADTVFITPDNIAERTQTYIEGLKTDIENSNTLIVTDDNLLTGQFLSEIKQKTTELKELIAFTKGSIHDTDKEIIRLTTLIKTSQEAKACPKVQRQDVNLEHIQNAKERFQMMKDELHGLIQSLFPGNFEMITEVLGQLMMEKLDETSNGYIKVTSENYQLIELLKDLNLVITNPYNNMVVKLAY